jgi:hypothetical protein
VTVAASVWCVICGGPPELTVTIEVAGVLAHYGACRMDAFEVTERAVVAFDLAERRAKQRAVETISGYIDASDQWLAEQRPTTGDEF